VVDRKAVTQIRTMWGDTGIEAFSLVISQIDRRAQEPKASETTLESQRTLQPTRGPVHGTFSKRRALGT
jgi:hypothetical protein